MVARNEAPCIFFHRTNINRGAGGVLEGFSPHTPRNQIKRIAGTGLTAHMQEVRHPPRSMNSSHQLLLKHQVSFVDYVVFHVVQIV